MLSYEQISKEYNIAITELKRSSSSLKIKGLLMGKYKVFTDREVNYLVRNKASVSPKYKLYNKRKLAILEAYFIHKSCNKVSKYLKINRDAVSLVIKEFLYTEHIVVESSINNNNTVI